MLIHHSFGFPNIFLKGGSRDPKDPPGSAPVTSYYMAQNFDGGIFDKFD